MAREFTFFRPSRKTIPYGSMPNTNDFLDAYSYLAAQVDDGDSIGIEIIISHNEAKWLHELNCIIYQDNHTGEMILADFADPTYAWCCLQRIIDQGVRDSDDVALTFAQDALKGMGFDWEVTNG